MRTVALLLTEESKSCSTRHLHYFIHYSIVHSAIKAALEHIPTPSPKTHLSSSDQEQKLSCEDTILRYCLMFAYLQDITDADGTVIDRLVVCPDLTEDFTAVLKTAKLPRALKLLADGIATHMERRALSELFYDGCANFDRKLIDLPFLTCLQSFMWATSPPVSDLDTIKDQLGPYHFAAPDKACVHYKARVENGRLLLRQERANEEDTKKTKKTTDLYHTGRT